MLIFANSGVGKTTLINNLKDKIKIIDTDEILCKLSGVSINNLNAWLKKISRSERDLLKIKLKLSVKTLEKSGYIILTPNKYLLQYCNIAIIQNNYGSINTLSLERENIYDLSLEKFEEEIKDYIKICNSNNIKIIFLKENQYLSDIMKIDSTNQILIDGM